MHSTPYSRTGYVYIPYVAPTQPTQQMHTKMPYKAKTTYSVNIAVYSRHQCLPWKRKIDTPLSWVFEDMVVRQMAVNPSPCLTLQLLKLTIDPNVPNEHGNTPLHYAAFWNYIGICEVSPP